MNLLALVVLSQTAAPCLDAPAAEAPPAFAAPAAAETPPPGPQLGSRAWAIATPIIGGLTFGLAGRRFVAEQVAAGKASPDEQGAGLEVLGLVVGTAVGIALGYFAGRLAREGSPRAQLASAVIYALGAAMVTFQAFEVLNDASHSSYSGGCPSCLL